MVYKLKNIYNLASKNTNKCLNKNNALYSNHKINHLFKITDLKRNLYFITIGICFVNERDND